MNRCAGLRSTHAGYLLRGRAAAPTTGRRRTWSPRAAATPTASPRSSRIAAISRWYQTEPLAADTRIADAPELRATVTADRSHGQLVPTLFDVDPAGNAVPISRGFLDLRYRGGLAAAEPMPVGRPTPVTVTFSNQDWTVTRGHRIALVIASSNTAWAVPDTPGLTVDARSSRLVLPVAP